MTPLGVAPAAIEPLVEPVPTATAVACVGLRKRFGSVVAVDGMSLAVAEGRLIAILGPSGCGKTTALRLVAGFEQPDAGEVRLHGRVVASPSGSVAPERRRVGMVFQDHALFPHLDVAGNVAYGLRALDRRQRQVRVGEVLDLVGLGGFEQRLPADLSGGQQQRVALARALAPQPAVVLLDEPFSNLDASLRASVRAEVRSILKTANATAIVVTHDQEEALSLADEVAVMDAGRVRQVGDPHTLYSRPADRFVAAFVGDAELVPAERAGRYFVHTSLGRLPTADPVATSKVEVVLRPEALRLNHSPTGAATVESSTYFGHDQIVHLRLADATRVRARLGPEVRYVAGDRVEVRVIGTVVALPAP